MNDQRPTMPDLTDVVERDGREQVCVERLLPRDARNLLLTEVVDALQQGGVQCFVEKASPFAGHTVGVLAEQRRQALEAIAAALPGPGRYLQESYPDALDQPLRRLTPQSVRAVPGRCQVLQVARFWSVADGALSYGMEYGVRIGFWVPSEAPSDRARPDRAPSDRAPSDRAPSDRYRAAGRRSPALVAHRDLLSPASIVVDGTARPSVALFDRDDLSAVRFPIDVVYTWVDGEDPAWRERFRRARPDADLPAHHREAHADSRYRSRDELKYSLRSLEMYAPWVRHVHLVTDGQVPPWLDTTCGRITVVDHRDIFRDPSVLPVFNSSAIISQLHHIEGLSEHYLYLNDDMFFGRDVQPEHFWHGSGIAKVFAADVVREFGPPRADDLPHFSISKNIRAFMERELGRTITHALQHTPYPQIRSVLDEIEQKYPDVVEATAGRRFRHHDDIALDQLFHYYAQATGRAVPDAIDYDYVDLGDQQSMARLRRLLATRAYRVFCLNDTPGDGGPPIPTEEISAFLELYFPMPSQFET